MAKDTATIQKLRQQTGLGIMDIKQALDEASGDEQKAMGILKKKMGEKMAKRADRPTGQGRIATYVHGDNKMAALVEIQCETDFVARAEDFVRFGTDLAMQAASMRPENVEDLLGQDFVKDTNKKIEDLLKEIIAKTGENVTIKRFMVYKLGEE